MTTQLEPESSDELASSYDVVVVGGGPAGTAAATVLARHGVDVAILERDSYPREKVCGDLLAPDCLRELEAIGALDAILEAPHVRHTHGYWASPGDEGLEIALPRETQPNFLAAITRYRFDHVLVRHARQQGAKLIQNCRVLATLKDGDRTVGVRARLDNVEHEIRARVVIACDGSHSILRRELAGAPSQDPDQGVAVRGYMKNVGGPIRFEVHWLEGILPGYFWLIPVEGDLVNVGVGVPKAQLANNPFGPDRTIRSLFFDILDHPRFEGRFEGAELLEGSLKGHFLNVAASPRKNTVGPVLFTGDAGFLTNPFTGEGIATALHSGRQAAEVAASVLSNGAQPSAQALSAYDERLERLRPGMLMSVIGYHFCSNAPPIDFLLRQCRRSPALGERVLRALLDRPEEMISYANIREIFWKPLPAGDSAKRPRLDRFLRWLLLRPALVTISDVMKRGHFRFDRMRGRIPAPYRPVEDQPLTSPPSKPSANSDPGGSGMAAPGFG